MRLRQLGWFKIKISIVFVVSAILIGCGVFRGASTENGSSRSSVEVGNQAEMSLTVPSKTLLTNESKLNFTKVISETVQKLSATNGAKARIDFLNRFAKLLDQATTEEDLYRLVSSQSENRSVDKVLFTGYYKPLFKGSFTRSANYSAPLFSLPKAKTSKTRKELVTSGALKANELIYLRDPFDAYLAEIQGSVGIVLDSGKIIHLAFAGSNNQKYVSIGKELIVDGKLTKNEATIPGIRAYFDRHPKEMREYIFRNPRLVFFRKSQGETLGSAGVELLAERTVATDRTVYPPGTLMFIKVNVPQKQADNQWGTKLISKFVVALDSGSAITGPNRIDLYLGEGTQVGEVAGRLNSRGKLEVFH